MSPARPTVTKRRGPMRKVAVCMHCGVPLPPRKGMARYRVTCGGRCQLAYGKKLAAKRPKERVRSERVHHWRGSGGWVACGRKDWQVRITVVADVGCMNCLRQLKRMARAVRT